MAKIYQTVLVLYAHQWCMRKNEYWPQEQDNDPKHRSHLCNPPKQENDIYLSVICNHPMQIPSSSNFEGRRSGMSSTYFHKFYVYGKLEMVCLRDARQLNNVLTIKHCSLYYAIYVHFFSMPYLSFFQFSKHQRKGKYSTDTNTKKAEMPNIAAICFLKIERRMYKTTPTRRRNIRKH